MGPTSKILRSLVILLYHLDTYHSSLSIWFKMKYLLASVLFTALVVGTSYADNNVKDLANKVKGGAECISKCITDHVGDVDATAECTKGCGNGAFSFKADAIVMIALFFMSYYLIN